MTHDLATRFNKHFDTLCFTLYLRDFRSHFTILQRVHSVEEDSSNIPLYGLARVGLDSHCKEIGYCALKEEQE